MASYSKKRKSDGFYDDQSPNKKSAHQGKHSTLVAAHYNQRQNTSCAERRNSKIYYMRNFNNWIKSVLIRKYVEKTRHENDCQQPIILDLGVGKGGDLLKWDKGNIKKLICTDIASTSIDQCRERYETLKRKNKNRRLFDAEFIVIDLGRLTRAVLREEPLEDDYGTRLESLYKKLSCPDVDNHISSCQFVIHYTFESEEQADTMVRNACSSLCEGGYFIGTTVNDATLLHKARESPDCQFGNDVYSVEFQNGDNFPEFGCKYIFKLHDVVDCPEFLLQKHTLVRLCEKYGMKLVEWKPFAQFFEENSKDKENFRLIRRMQALEVFPPQNDQLNSSKPDDYSHAEAECQRIRRQYPSSNPRVATLSKTEWEAASLYVVYVFVKDEENRWKIEADEASSSNEKIPLVIV